MCENVECFLKLQSGLNDEEKRIHLPEKKQITIGRGSTYGIKDLCCSKNQLLIEADMLNRMVKIRRIGRNPSLLAGLPMEQNKEYLAPEGMTLKVTPDVEYLISFSGIKNNMQPDKELSNSGISKFMWSKNPSGTLLFCQTNGVNFNDNCKIASFDLDGTLIKPKSGYVFPQNDEDWILWHSEVKPCLKKLINDGYNLVMFTNQAQLEISTQNKRESFKTKIQNIISEINLNFAVLIAKGRDIYRKPAPGMWEYLQSKIPGEVDMSSSFYVGDAAGRFAIKSRKITADHDVTDRLFARNVGFKFYTPEEYFLKEPARPFEDVTFHPMELPIEDYPDLMIPSNPSELIVMVGSPASGKSYFAQTVLSSEGYIRISRDDLVTWKKCRDKISNAILQRKNAVYDATNPDQESRKAVLDICNERNFTNVRCFVMTTSEDHCEHNNRFRQLVNNSVPVPHTAIVTFNKRLEEPTLAEGFVSVVKIPFVAKFLNEEQENIYKCYLLGKKNRRKK